MRVTGWPAAILEKMSSTIEQMRLVNALCWAKNFADGLTLTRSTVLN
jgi:hypothetical protein